MANRKDYKPPAGRRAKRTSKVANPDQLPDAAAKGNSRAAGEGSGQGEGRSAVLGSPPAGQLGQGGPDAGQAGQAGYAKLFAAEAGPDAGQVAKPEFKEALAAEAGPDAGRVEKPGGEEALAAEAGPGAGASDWACPPLSSLTAKPVEWLWPGFIPFGAPTLLAGRTGSGKSTVATCVAAAVTGGPPLPGDSPMSPASVLWFTTEEEHRREVKARMHAAGGDESRVYLPELRSDGMRAPAWHLPEYEGMLMEQAMRRGARLVVFDAVTGYVARDLLPDTGQAARLVMESLARVGEVTGAAIVAIKHPRKGTTGEAVEQVSGSMEWVNVPRSVLTCEDWPEGEGLHVLSSLRCKLGRRPPSLRFALVERQGSIAVEWKGTTSLTSEQLLEARGDGGTRDALADAKRFLREELEAEAKATKEIRRLADESGISLITLRRAKHALGVTAERLAYGADGHWVWRKPEGGWPQ